MENKKRICFVAQFPPPMHGLSKAVETLYNSSISSDFKLEKIDITNNKKFLITVICILKSKADLFYFTNSQTIGGNIRDLIILKLFKIKKKKVLIHLHGGYYRKLVDNDMKPWQRKANYKAISKVDGAIVLGPSLRWIFEGMISDSKIFTVPNCIDDQFFMSDYELKEKVERIKLENVHHILWLSNFIKSKGYQIVLEMARREKERVEAGEEKKFHFDFAGNFFDEQDKDFFDSYIIDHQLKDVVTYHGVALGDEKRELLKKCVYFMLPTKYPNEGQPISILEAMGNGMLVISSKYAGIPDLISDEKNGYFINESDIDAIYKKMCNLLDNELTKIMLANRKEVEENYRETTYIDNLRQIFINILKG